MHRTRLWAFICCLVILFGLLYPKTNSPRVNAAESTIALAQRATNTPRPTNTSEPTRTPRGGDETDSTNTPVPTNTPDPTNTPVPTNTSIPTNTPVPTETPPPTNTPVPTDTAVPTATGTVDAGAPPVTATNTAMPAATAVPTDAPTQQPTATQTPVTGSGPVASSPTPKPIGQVDAPAAPNLPADVQPESDSAIDSTPAAVAQAALTKPGSIPALGGKPPLQTILMPVVMLLLFLGGLIVVWHKAWQAYRQSEES